MLQTQSSRPPSGFAAPSRLRLISQPVMKMTN